MEFKGTKGKWNLRGSFKALEVFSSYGSICNISRQSSIDSNVDSQAEANAKLIACTPEMLEMLIKIRRRFRIHPEDEQEIDALINKATE